MKTGFERIIGLYQTDHWIFHPSSALVRADHEDGGERPQPTELIKTRAPQPPFVAGPWVPSAGKLA